MISLNCDVMSLSEMVPRPGNLTYFPLAVAGAGIIGARSGDAGSVISLIIRNISHMFSVSVHPIKRKHVHFTDTWHPNGKPREIL